MRGWSTRMGSACASPHVPACTDHVSTVNLINVKINNVFKPARSSVSCCWVKREIPVKTSSSPNFTKNCVTPGCSPRGFDQRGKGRSTKWFFETGELFQSFQFRAHGLDTEEAEPERFPGEQLPPSPRCCRGAAAFLRGNKNTAGGTLGGGSRRAAFCCLPQKCHCFQGKTGLGSCSPRDIAALLLQSDALGAQSGGMGGGRCLGGGTASECVCFQARGSKTDEREHGCLPPSKSGGHLT